jgi:hypothetical protein
MKMWLTLALSASLIVGASPAAAQSAETAGMITEIKPG